MIYYYPQWQWRGREKGRVRERVVGRNGGIERGREGEQSYRASSQSKNSGRE
jgi:hypothetical protein